MGGAVLAHGNCRRPQGWVIHCMDTFMETAIERFTVLSYFVICLSHILQPHAWVRFFVNLREKGDAGFFVVALLHLPFGALIGSFHNVMYGWEYRQW